MLTHSLSVPAIPGRVVLVGARGFIATRLRAALEAAATPVAAVGSREVDLTAPGAADSLASRLRENDAVVFLSALTPDRGKGIETLMANLRMGEAVCAAVGRVKPRHVVYVSSDAVYRDDASKVDEGSPTDGVTLYGSMHALRERMLMSVAGAAGATVTPGSVTAGSVTAGSVTAGSTVPLAILRPTLVFGAGDTHNSYGPNRFMRAALKDRVIPLFGEGEEQRDHVYVDDLVRLIQAVLARISSGILNLVTGQSASFADMARRVAALAGDAKVVCKPRAPGPILHRHFDPTALFRAFPDFRFTPRDEALALAWQGHTEQVTSDK